MPGACLGATGSLDPQVFRLFGAWQNAGTPERQAWRAVSDLQHASVRHRQRTRFKRRTQDPVAAPIRPAPARCAMTRRMPAITRLSMALNIGIADPSRRTAESAALYAA